VNNIIIFGASSYGEKVFTYYSNKEEINIIYFCDNDTSKHNTYILDKKIISPENLSNLSFDKIVIASSYEDEIKRQLLSMNISEEKIEIFSTNYDKMQFQNNETLYISEALMLDIANLFNENSISYHIDHGTLLGLIRDGKILPWDIDIDFAIPFEEKDRVLEVLDNYLINYKNKYSSTNNWEYFIVEGIVDLKKDTHTPLYITIINKEDHKENNIGLDLHIKYTFEQDLCWVIAQRRLTVTKNLCFPTKKFKFKNTILKIPNNADGYMRELYGNWEVPDKSWNYNKYSNIDHYYKSNGKYNYE